jgi:hypothetical protein
MAFLMQDSFKFVSSAAPARHLILALKGYLDVFFFLSICSAKKEYILYKNKIQI